MALRGTSHAWNVRRFYCLASSIHVGQRNIKDGTNNIKYRTFGNHNGSKSAVNSILSQLPKIEYVSKCDGNRIMAHFKERKDIKEEKDMLLLSRYDLNLRFLLLGEFGIHRPFLHDILYIGVVLEAPISALHSFGILRNRFDVVERFLENAEKLDLPEDVSLKIKAHLINTGGCSLAYMHLYVLMHYLSHRFKVDLKTVKDVFNFHGLPSWKPLQAYPHICDIIIQILQLDFSYVDHTDLLSMDINNALKILRMCPKIGEVPILDVVKQHPNLLQIPFENVYKWCSLLKKYKVNKISVTPDVINLFKEKVSKSIEERLKQLSVIQNFEVLAASTSFVQVLRNPHAVKKLIDSAHAGQELSDINSVLKNVEKSSLPPKKISMKVASYIASELGINEREVAKFKIPRKLRTYHGFLNTQKVLKLLLEHGFSADQILNGIQALGFEYTALKLTLDKFATLPEVQPYKEWMKNPEVISLLSYLHMRKNLPS